MARRVTIESGHWIIIYCMKWPESHEYSLPASMLGMHETLAISRRHYSCISTSSLNGIEQWRGPKLTVFNLSFYLYLDIDIFCKMTVQLLSR